MKTFDFQHSAAAHLCRSRGTLVCRGTQVGKHWSERYSNSLLSSYANYLHPNPYATYCLSYPFLSSLLGAGFLIYFNPASGSRLTSAHLSLLSQLLVITWISISWSVCLLESMCDCLSLSLCLSTLVISLVDVLSVWYFTV